MSSQRRAIVDEMLQHPANRMIGIATNSYDDETSGGLDMVRADEWTPIAQTYGHCAAQIADPASAWVDAVVDFLDKVSAVSAVIVKMDAMHVSTEVTGCGMTYHGVFQHPAPDEFHRMGHPDNVAHIGTRYVRFPRWGTLMSHDHVAQLGGAATIIAAVRPAVVRELSGGVYFQLTASIDDARSDEAAAKQRGFVELAAPLLPS